jgi:hypothetical protein
MSGVGWVSALCGAVGIGAAIPAALAARRHKVALIVAGLGITWVLYGWAVGAMPAGSENQVRAWVETEGRPLVVLGVVIAMVGMQRASTLPLVLRAISIVVISTTAVGLVLFFFGVDDVGGDLFFGFASSHHVPGFLSCAVFIVLIVDPSVISARWPRVVSLIVLFLAAVASGSRTSMLATLVVVAGVVVARRGARTLLVPGLLGLVAIGVAFAGSSRLRDTASLVVTGELFDDAIDVYKSGSTRRAVELSSFESETNILVRVVIWSEAVDQFTSSPIIGIGRYRVNDLDPVTSGIDGVVSLVTDGERSHSDEQPHNQYLYLLAETGVVGLFWGLVPFVWAWRTARPKGEGGDDVRGQLLRSSLLFGGLIGLVSAGLLGTGAGLITCMLIFGCARACELSSASELELPGGAAT